jgi:DNA replication protein DnaC
MRSEDEIKSYAGSRAARMLRCQKCQGGSLSCECRLSYDLDLRLFESCVPSDFWYSKREDVQHNVDVFSDVIEPYVKRVPIAHKVGAGLFLYGANGCGKTMFLSWILVRILRSALFSCYYTTMPNLTAMVKKTWNDRSGQMARHLETMIVTSDFVVFDELGKERAGSGDSFTRVELERFLKARFDAGRATLYASNAAPSSLGVDPESGGYGQTIMSMIEGRSQVVPMEAGDFRKGRMRDDVARQMGWSK